jgi:TorA maturation chaperone TorD
MAEADSERILLAEYAAITFSALGALLYHEPDEGLVVQLTGEGFFKDLPFASDDPRVQEGLRLLDDWAKQAATQPVSEVTAALRREWLRLLVGYGEPAAPPWAAYYFEKDPMIFGKKTLEVRGCYARHGLEIERKYHEPDDHLGLMLQFLSVLATREVAAHAVGDGSKEVALRLEQGQFIRQNMMPWVPHWQSLVAKESKSRFYQGVALLVHGSLDAYTHCLGE